MPFFKYDDWLTNLFPKENNIWSYQRLLSLFIHVFAHYSVRITFCKVVTVLVRTLASHGNILTINRECHNWIRFICDRIPGQTFKLHFIIIIGKLWSEDTQWTATHDTFVTWSNPGDAGSWIWPSDWAVDTYVVWSMGTEYYSCDISWSVWKQKEVNSLIKATKDCDHRTSRDIALFVCPR